MRLLSKSRTRDGIRETVHGHPSFCFVSLLPPLVSPSVLRNGLSFLRQFLHEPRQNILHRLTPFPRTKARDDAGSRVCCVFVRMRARSLAPHKAAPPSPAGRCVGSHVNHVCHTRRRGINWWKEPGEREKERIKPTSDPVDARSSHSSRCERAMLLYNGGERASGESDVLI